MRTSVPLTKRFADVARLTGFFTGVICVYLVLAAALILAQVERSIDRLSLSRAHLNGQRLTGLLAQASSNWLNLAEIPDLNAKLEEALLRDSEISAIVIRRPDGSVLASTGSKALISMISEEWRKSSARHFMLQVGNQPFVVRASGIEFCAMEARNISGETVAVVWLARRRETARRTLEAAFSAITHTASIFALPVILLASWFWWLGVKWYLADVLESRSDTSNVTTMGATCKEGDHSCDRGS
jgi:hypothetical protein